jgi:hypothetical protein
VNEVVHELSDEHKDCVFAFADDMNVICKAKTWAGLVIASRRFLQKSRELYAGIGAKLNAKKTKIIPLAHHRNKIPWGTLRKEVQVVKSARILGILVDSSLSFQDEIQKLRRELKTRTHWLSFLQRTLSLKRRRMMYTSFWQGFLDYHLLPVWPWICEASRSSITLCACRAGQKTLQVGSTTSGALALRELDLLLPSARWVFLKARRILKLKNSESEAQKTLGEDYRFLLSREGEASLPSKWFLPGSRQEKWRLREATVGEDSDTRKDAFQAAPPRQRRLWRMNESRNRRSRDVLTWIPESSSVTSLEISVEKGTSTITSIEDDLYLTVTDTPPPHRNFFSRGFGNF